MAKTIIDVVQGLAQAAANSWDGAHDERLAIDGKVRKVGLKREEGDIFLDSRVIDAFKIYFSGPKMCVKYNSEVTVKEMHRTKFQQETEAILKKIITFLKKEYKAITKDDITITADGDADILVQYVSQVRSFITAVKWYTIGGLNKDTEAIDEDVVPEDLDPEITRMLQLGGLK